MLAVVKYKSAQRRYEAGGINEESLNTIKADLSDFIKF